MLFPFLFIIFISKTTSIYLLVSVYVHARGCGMYDTRMKVRELHAGLGFQLLSLQLSSGCQAWRQGSSPPEPAHWCLFGDSILLRSPGLPRTRCVAKTEFKPAAALLSPSPEGCWDYRRVSAHPAILPFLFYGTVGEALVFRLSLKVWCNSGSKAFGHGSQCHGFAIELFRWYIPLF